MPTGNESASTSVAPAALPVERRSAAVALAYGAGDTAPRVLAKGRGVIAEAIIARAKENGLHVHQSAELIALLMQVDLDEYIPPGLYVAVAEVLAWLYRHDRSGGAATRQAASDIEQWMQPDGPV